LSIDFEIFLDKFQNSTIMILVIEMNGYEKRTAAKKAAIIEVARELFTQRGIQDVSISEIASQANVSQVSIYNYFDDKNALAKEAFISYVETEIGRYEQILEQDIPFTEKLEIIIMSKSSMVNQIALSHFNEQALDDKILHQVFQEALLERAIVVYNKFIEMGKIEGVIDKNIQSAEKIHRFFNT